MSKKVAWEIDYQRVVKSVGQGIIGRFKIGRRACRGLFCTSPTRRKEKEVTLGDSDVTLRNKPSCNKGPGSL